VWALLGITISIDGKDAWRDNVFVERFWRSIEYEEVYLRAYESASEAKHYIGRYIDYYNKHRPHSSHGGQTPNAAYAATQALPGSLPQPRRTGDVKAG
jgi:putative transposase